MQRNDYRRTKIGQKRPISVMTDGVARGMVTIFYDRLTLYASWRDQLFFGYEKTVVAATLNTAENVFFVYAS